MNHWFSNALSFLIILQVIVGNYPIQAHAMAQKSLSSYHAKKCGDFELKQNEQAEMNIEVCSLDEGNLKKHYQTRGSKTEIRAPQELFQSSKLASDVIDKVLLEQVQTLAKTKFDAQFKELLSLKAPTEADYPESKGHRDEKKMEKDLKEAKSQIEEIQKGVQDLQTYLFDSSEKPIHQIRKLLSLYPEIEEEITRAHPEYAPLICKYEAWKHRNETISKVAKILGPIVGIAMVIAIPVTAGVAIPALAGVMIGFGSAEVALGSLQIAGSIANWDDVRVARAAKRFLALDQELEDHLKMLQKKNPKTVKDLEDIKTIKASLLSQNDLKDLKDLKKQGRKRVTALIGGGFKMMMGAASIYGGSFASSYFSGFKAKSPATVSNPGQSGGTIGGSPVGGGVGGDDGG